MNLLHQDYKLILCGKNLEKLSGAIKTAILRQENS